VVTKAAVLAEGPEIRAEDLAAITASTSTGFPQRFEDDEADAMNLDHTERRTILEALAATGGHQQKAAERLGISRRTLSRKLKLYGSERIGAAL
jgi:DNA-binding NtrC family response regulator